ncbi:hypothetical protein LTS10_004156 [Elasticomyces elasticus]|nr:hypothetical protein LTS10_004156 [Elasticomyces elasticus]
MATDSLLDRLPAELRLEIYALVLSTDTTTRRRITRHGRGFQPDPRFKPDPSFYDDDRVFSPIPGLALLTVCRSVYSEALATLFEENVLVIQRSELCLSEYNQDSLRLFDHLTNLEINEMQQGTCSMSEGKLCENCVDLSGIFHIIATLPRLRTIVFEYGAETWWKEWDPVTDFVTETRHGPFSDLRRAIKNHSFLDYTMECAAVGVYRLLGPSLGRKIVTFRDSDLSHAWADPSDYPYNNSRLRKLVDKIHHMMYSRSVRGQLPLQIANIWPTGVPATMSNLQNIEALDFLEQFDEAF